MRYFVLILFAAAALRANENEFLNAVNALDLEKIEQLIKADALRQLEPLEIIAITQVLQPHIKNHTQNSNIACVLGKFIVATALLIPSYCCIYNACALNEDDSESGNAEILRWRVEYKEWDSGFTKMEKFLNRYWGPIGRYLNRFIHGQISAVAGRISGGDQNLYHLPLIAMSGFCAAFGGYLALSAIKQLIEMPNHHKAERIMNRIKAELLHIQRGTSHE